MDFSDSNALLKAAQSVRVCLKPPSLVLLDEEDVSGLIRQCLHLATIPARLIFIQAIRTPEVSRSTVPVANHPGIRAILVQQQRAMADTCRYTNSMALAH